ncbi:UNVERIFIED_CONTAM: hypothetical protein FKN15_024111 [Acipenser sinensis]
MLNSNTWKLVFECGTRSSRSLSSAAGFALLGSIVGRSPFTWTVISLLRGEPYVCTLARFPCKDVPAEMESFKEEIVQRLKYNSLVIQSLL